MPSTVVGAAHAAPVFLDTDATIAKACDLIAEAGRTGVELLVFSEVFVPGFPYWINLFAPDLQHELLARYANASVQVPGPEITTVARAARAAGVHVVLGVSERDGGTSYNTQVFIDAEGQYLGKHRKLQPTFAERYVWGQGDGSTLQVFDTAVGRVGGLVCWEHTMDLARHALTLKGEQIHAASWPGLEASRNLTGYFDVQVEALSRTQALCGQCFVVVAGSPVTPEMLSLMEAEIGPQDLLTTGGGWSAILSPMGNLLGGGPRRGLEEGIVSASIDLAEITALKTLVDSGGHFARPEVLRLVIDERPVAVLERTGPQPAPIPKPLDAASP